MTTDLYAERYAEMEGHAKRALEIQYWNLALGIVNLVLTLLVVLKLYF